uniref:Tc1-like transposase DDE domain-containing protein n=1 Tax=Amphimedon queenslandica TaxID=400682 RepID=A0A1X7SNW9_AMPQE
MGWIPNTTLIFQSKKDTGDYHDEMTGGVVSIEEEMPLKSWTKSKMIEWLVFYGVEFGFDSTKSQLFSIIQDATRRMGFTKQYVIDKMDLDAGHEVVRLPVAHCTLNPIELAWAQVKGHIKANTS